MAIASSVVLVEDDADERTALGRVLAASGFDVRSYASAEDYLASKGPDPPLCLLLDMQLAGMSGMDLLRELRTEGSTLPVIVITGSDDVDWRRQVQQLGCVAYLRKPFQGRQLAALLHSLAGGRQSHSS